MTRFPARSPRPRSVVIISNETPFSYTTAFCRNLGWVTAEEQETLRRATVAIAGMGGVGGSHLLTLARLGIGQFTIADFDVFELHNMNRQAGARMSSMGRPKADVIAELARDINPEVNIRIFGEGVNEDNLDAFVDHADIYVDGLDFFALETRRRVFAACRARGIPAITVAPLGMGAALLNFLPGGMSFDDYFRLEGHEPSEQALRFALGLAPAMLQFRYIADPSFVDLAAQKGPSTPMACELCAGIAATEALKLLLGRGPVRAAPRGTHFDAYRLTFRRTWRPGGNANPLHRLLLNIARRRLATPSQESR